MDPILRMATPKDSAAIHALTLQLGYEPTEEEVRQTLEGLGEGHVVLVAEANSKVIAWIELIAADFLASGEEAHICGLVVDEEFRGQGIGKRLCVAAEDWVRSKGISSIRVRSRQSRERAHQFYLDLGYELYKSQVVFRKDL